MNRIFTTGDVHGEMEMKRLSKKRWPKGATLTRDDFLIVLGDFGLIFHPVTSRAEEWWIKWLSERPYTVLFVDGNHDNHKRLEELPKVEMFGGEVWKIADNIFHLRRGEIYEIAGKKILAFGGAQSVDKEHRIVDVSWWAEEIPNYAEMDRCIENIIKHEHKVDFIFAHTCPNTLAHIMAAKINIFEKNSDPTCGMLEHIVTTCEFEGFYCGHWHRDEDMGKYHFMYHRILELGLEKCHHCDGCGSVDATMYTEDDTGSATCTACDGTGYV